MYRAMVIRSPDLAREGRGLRRARRSAAAGSAPSHPQERHRGPRPEAGARADLLDALDAEAQEEDDGPART